MTLKTKKFGPFIFKIDRPAGYVKEWPRPDGSVKRFTYPVDYGYWPKIKGEDGEGLDAFVGDDEKGHLESFQKLNPDGSLDETKFLLGVSDAEREKIYKLYGTEVHARRVYETFDDVQKALDTFKTKMHKVEKKLADFHAVKMAAVFGVGNTVTDSLREADSLWRRVAEKATEPIQYVHLSPGVAGVNNGTHIKLPIESENILEKYKGNILASPHTTERLLHEKAHTLAHEIGHGQWDKHPVGFVTQDSLIHGIGRTPLPHVLSVGAGLFGRTRTRRALGVLGGALSAAAPLLNEYVASRNGLKLLQQVGASPSSIADYLAGEKYNLSGHLRHTGVNVGLGLASMGAREAYDWYKAKHSPEPEKKLADFHAVKTAKAAIGLDGEALLDKLTETSPYKIEEAEIPSSGEFRFKTREIKLHPSLNNFPDNWYEQNRTQRDPKLDRVLSNVKPYVLAHEMGHGQWGETPLGSLMQTPVMHGVGQSFIPPLLSVGAGLLAPTPISRAVGVLSGTALSAVPYLNERMADRNAAKNFRSAGASNVAHKTLDAFSADARKPHLRRIGVNLGLGSAALGARALFDHVLVNQPKLADFHAVKCASNVFNALNWIPEPYQDRVQTPYQMLTSARNTPALTSTQPNLRMLQISRENSQY